MVLEIADLTVDELDEPIEVVDSQALEKFDLKVDAAREFALNDPLEELLNTVADLQLLIDFVVVEGKLDPHVKLFAKLSKALDSLVLVIVSVGLQVLLNL